MWGQSTTISPGSLGVVLYLLSDPSGFCTVDAGMWRKMGSDSIYAEAIAADERGGGRPVHSVGVKRGSPAGAIVRMMGSCIPAMDFISSRFNTRDSCRLHF